jgi:hypothetical protein
MLRPMILVVLATAASYPAGALIGQPFLVPFLNAAPAWWLMAGELRAGRVTNAIATMLIWAAAMAVIATAWSALVAPESPEDNHVFLRSEYRTEMLRWVRTGQGPEGDPAVFVPQHLASAAMFSLAALATGGALAMPMGAVLMNSMGDYVGSMAHRSAHPAASIVLGWHPWAVIRIIGFVIIGVVLSGPVLARVWRFPFSLRAQWGWLRIGAGLLVLDIALKWLLAPTWGRFLRDIAGW